MTRVFVGTVHEGLVVVGDCLDEVVFAIKELKPNVTPEDCEIWEHEIEEQGE